MRRRPNSDSRRQQLADNAKLDKARGCYGRSRKRRPEDIRAICCPAGNVPWNRWGSDLRLRIRAPDVWEPELWGPETLMVDSVTAAPGVARPFGAVQMDLIYVNP